MSFILTPRFAPAYQTPHSHPFGCCAPVSRPTNRIARPRPQRPQHSSFNHFFSQVDELLSEIDREAQRQAQLEAQREAQWQAHIEAKREALRQLEERKRALQAKFDINPTEQGWQIDGTFQGFDQENIDIEVTNDNALKIAGNTEWQAEKSQPSQSSQVESGPVTEQQPSEEAEAETVPEQDTDTTGVATPGSDTESHKSYQPTVEDDFEDLGAETSSLVSSSRPSSPTEAKDVKEPKGKEKAVDNADASQTAVATQPQPEVPVQQQQQQEPQQKERVHGSFERTFRFPERIDVANVNASFRDGVLRITVPKAQVPQARRIAIL